jgi:hypothetical protein
MPKLFAIKPMSLLTAEASDEGENTLKRSLGALNLITLGIGAIIGAGIFVLTGKAAALYAGPAVSLSFVLAGIVCAFAGLCYAEFASIIPIAGSAYTYGYATLGEFVAWIIGWDLVLEYAFGAATVAAGWSGYLNSLLQQLHIYMPPRFTAVPGTELYFYQEKWQPLTTLPANLQLAGLPHVTALFNLVAMLGVLLITAILVIGIKESANFNSAIVIVKIGIVGVFLVVGGWFLLKHPSLAWDNWHCHGRLVDLLCVYRLRCGFDGSAGGEESEARYADRDSRFAGGLHNSLHSCFDGADRVGEVHAVERGRSGCGGHRCYRHQLGLVAGEAGRGLRIGDGDAGDVARPVARFLLDVEGRAAAEVGFGDSSEVPHAMDFDDCGWMRGGGDAGVQGRGLSVEPGEHRHAAGLHDCLRRSVGAACAAAKSGAAVQDAVCSAGADSGHSNGCVRDEPSTEGDLGSYVRLAGIRAADLLRLFDPAQQGAEDGEGEERQLSF